MKDQDLNVIWNKVDPDPKWIDFDGVHFPIFDNLSFFYSLFSWQNTEEYVQEQLRPWLTIAKREWLEKRNGVSTPENAVPVS